MFIYIHINLAILITHLTKIFHQEAELIILLLVLFSGWKNLHLDPLVDMLLLSNSLDAKSLINLCGWK